MFLINLKRILKSGFVNFWRNGVVSIASVLVMTVTLFVIGMLVFANAVLSTSLDRIKDKVDVNVYFVLDAEEEDIFALKNSLEQFPEVAFVTYTDRDEALANFRARHENDYLTIQALDELDENPLGASLSIKASETSQYASIAQFLEDQRDTSEETSFIESINYFKNKIAIDRLTNITNGVEKLIFATTIFLGIMSIIIMFNTIRLAIYTAREEIAVMRLVGASNKYIRGPFVVEGIMYGVFSAIITIAIFYPVTFWIGDTTESFFGSINLFDYYIQNFAAIFILILSSGVLLGAVSSYLAVRKYLKV